MQEEIFGPILPVLPFSAIPDCIAMLRERPKPLALYLFTGDRRLQRRVVAEVASGGVCINDTISHIIAKELPFGGVGMSGMGSYHGKSGFDCFTHYRSVMRRPLRPDPAFRYPPPRVSLETLKKVYRFLLRK
ncbi:MAG: aldehyde dehydrogenase family protein, partial [Candidatus Hydrogenedentes bacterium]|nr:aldehyde dehydrogenase family protein [Candidatus Hydrogenedentota bacterium]